MHNHWQCHALLRQRHKNDDEVYDDGDHHTLQLDAYLFDFRCQKDYLTIMAEYDPDNPSHPMDKWWERNKNWLKWLLLPAIPSGFAFFMYMLVTTLKFGSGLIVALGLPWLLICFMGIAHLIEFWDKNAD